MRCKWKVQKQCLGSWARWKWCKHKAVLGLACLSKYKAVCFRSCSVWWVQSVQQEWIVHLKNFVPKEIGYRARYCNNNYNLCNRKWGCGRGDERFAKCPSVSHILYSPNLHNDSTRYVCHDHLLMAIAGRHRKQIRLPPQSFFGWGTELAEVENEELLQYQGDK